MAWKLLPTDYTDAVWSGLKRYTQVDNSDGTVSFNDVTTYTNKEKSFFGAKDANRMNEALNYIMSMLENGTNLYEEFQTYFTTQKELFKSSGDSSYQELTQYFVNLKAQGDSSLAQIEKTYEEHMTTYEGEQTAAFNTWFAGIKGKLNEDIAGTHSIDRITPHCVVGQLSAESICGCFISTSRQASCNYGIGTDGRISMSVEEKNRSWCSSSRENDQRAVTIECASDKTTPYAFNDAVYASLVNLCVDICQRNDKSKLLWLGDKNKTLAYAPKSDEMVLTVHRWFANKSCPGDWLYNRLGNLAAEVTKRLTGGSTDTGKVDVPSDGKTLYRVQTGAFSKRSNADAWAAKLKVAGFDTYIIQMDNLYKVQVGAYSQKSNAENMMAKLKAAGYDAFITTKSGTAAGTAKKSAAEIAKEIYNGTCSDARWSSWGNGADRVNRLKQAGYDPSEVQSEVNKLF